MGGSASRISSAQEPVEDHGHHVNGSTKILLAARTQPAPEQLWSHPAPPSITAVPLPG